jgi:hypothetical protein
LRRAERQVQDERDVPALQRAADRQRQVARRAVPGAARAQRLQRGIRRDVLAVVLPEREDEVARAHLGERVRQRLGVEAREFADGLLVGQVMHHHAEAGAGGPARPDSAE